MRVKYPPFGPFGHILVRGGLAFLLFLSFSASSGQVADEPVVPDSVRNMPPKKVVALLQQSLKSFQSKPLADATLRLHIGRMLTDLAKYDSATIYLSKANTQFIALKDSSRLADSYYELARIQTLRGKYKEAIPIQQKAFVLYQKTKNNDGAIKSLLELGYASYRLKKYPQAKEFYLQSLDRAKRTSNYEQMVDAYDGLAVTYEALKDYRNSISSVRLMQGAYDTITVRKHRQQMNDLENKYSSLLEEKDRALVATESQHRQVQSDRLLRLIERDDIRLTFYLVALAMAVVMLGLFIAWLITQRYARSAESKLRKERSGIKLGNEQFEIISKQIHDDLIRSLNDISLSTSQLSAGRSQAEVKTSAVDVKVQTETLIGTMLDLVWLINPNNRHLEGLIAFIRERTNTYLKNSGLNFMIVVPDRIPNVEMTTLERVNLYSVTNELLHHSVHSAKATGLTLSMTIEGKQLIFRIKENTGAVTEHAINKRADELKTHREKMEQIDGTIGVINEDGAMVVIYRKEIGDR
jgi:tetratricopeptide (TPR) repeat protein